MKVLSRATYALSRTAGRGCLSMPRRGSIVVMEGACAIGRPAIHLVQGANVTIGSGSVLNSRPKGYHSHMHSPVRLIADAPGASITIGNECRINGACLHAKGSIVVGDRVLMASGATVVDTNGHVVSPPTCRISNRDLPRPVIIEDDVWIGLNAVVLPGSVIRRGSIIGANVVVSGVVPANSVLRATFVTEQLRE